MSSSSNSTSHIPLKKSRGKGSQRKKTNDDSQEIVEVFEESEPEPKPVKRNTTSRRSGLEEIHIFVNGKTIISDDQMLFLDISSSGVKPFKTLPSVKSKTCTCSKPSSKSCSILKLVFEKEDAYIYAKSLRKPKKTSKETTMYSKGENERNWYSYRGSRLSPSRFGPQIQDDHYSDIQDTNDEDDENEIDGRGNLQVMKRLMKCKAKADAEKTLKVKDDAKKTELPPTSLALSVILGNPKGKALAKGSKTGKSALAKEPGEEPIAEVVMDDAGDDRFVMMINHKMLLNPRQPRLRIQNGSTQPPRPPTPDPEWNKHFCYICYLTVVVDYFFNNDLKYLKSYDPKRKYTMSITKTKAARYEIEGIEDLVPTLWSAYLKGVMIKDALKGIQNIWRADRQLYKFKEGDFVDLHLNDIEDMLLLVVQHNLFHLTNSDLIDFIVALRMFTRCLIIKKCVEDL
ncbi:hypothetical protein Tco_0975537 [Tanacetum coccineum]|uniref:Uncharacterized protein n=1 Tax=Tanacetum coccineum TaxID=301880 RepID=A0ABQ5EEQ0_9ASTR